MWGFGWTNYEDEYFSIQDYPTSQELLMRDNINLNKLQQYAVDAAQFSTDLPNLEFAVSNDLVIFVWGRVSN